MKKELIIRNIFGKPSVKLGGGSSSDNGVINVDSLPETGAKQGVIYYNTSDGKYYIYDGEAYSTVGSTEIPVVQQEDIPNYTPPLSQETRVGNYYEIEPNKYYCIDDVTYRESGGVTQGNVIVLHFTPKEDVAEQYFGRFTAPADNTTIKLPSTVYFADATPDIEANHTYEFNIFYNICLLTDITVQNKTTSPSSEETT